MVKSEKYKARFDERFFKGIAHRGLHDDKFTENGLNAFKAAIDKGLAFEFDIHLTKDGYLVVCHDDDLKRTTGKEGLIRELTLRQIKDDYRLFDGGEIPTLEEVFSLNQERVPMVIELKAENKNHKELARAANEAFKKIENTRIATIISFDPRALSPIRRFTRGLLICKMKNWVLMFRHKFDYLDVEHVLLDDKRVRGFGRRKYINAWTIDNEEKLDATLGKADMVTFQHLSAEQIGKIGEYGKQRN